MSYIPFWEKSKEQSKNLMKTLKPITWKRLSVKTVKNSSLKFILKNIH